MNEQNRKGLEELRRHHRDMDSTLDLKVAAMRSGNDALKQVAESRARRICELQRKTLSEMGLLPFVVLGGAMAAQEPSA